MKLTTMMMTMSIITPMLNHPLTMGFILIMQTTMICLSLSLLTKSSWYSYILFISMISGMMIMFMYMASLVSNKKFKMNKKLMLMLMITFTMMMMIEQIDNSMETMNFMKEMKMNCMNFEELKSTTKFFNMKKSMLTITMILILLISMITVTNLISSFEGPLKSK